MTTAISSPPIQGLKALTYPPRPGEHYLSVDLTKVADVVKVFDLAKQLGFKPELVQISTRRGTTEIHALLFHNRGVEQSPMEEENELSKRIEELADEIETDAIRHVYGRLKAA
jgi:arginyl-tRNA synthetase